MDHLLKILISLKSYITALKSYITDDSEDTVNMTYEDYEKILIRYLQEKGFTKKYNTERDYHHLYELKINGIYLEITYARYLDFNNNLQTDLRLRVNDRYYSTLRWDYPAFPKYMDKILKKTGAIK